MASIYKEFPTKYLKAEDLEGKSFNLTIDHVMREEMFAHGGGTENKLVVYFKEAKKGLVLNKTNAFSIAEILGNPETDDWGGGMIQLYPTTIQAFGAETEAIRVRKCPAVEADSAPAPVVELEVPGQDLFGSDESGSSTPETGF